MSEENTVEAVELVLGQPMPVEYSENALKVRRNLLAVSTVAVVMQLGGATLATNAPIFGFQFSDLTVHTLKLGLLGVVVYLTVHFLFYVVESFVEWRLRLTGCRVAFITGTRYESVHKDIPIDPRQSTLYNWWKDHAKQIGNIPKKLAEWDSAMEESDKALRVLIAEPQKFENLNNALQLVSQVANSSREINQSVQRARETLEALRIPASLARFDRWFSLFLRIENFRWLLVDTLFPLLLGIYAIALLSHVVIV